MSNFTLREELRICEVIEEPVMTTETMLDSIQEGISAVEGYIEDLNEGDALSADTLMRLREEITKTGETARDAIDKCAAFRDRPLRDVTYELERHGFTIARVR